MKLGTVALVIACIIAFIIISVGWLLVLGWLTAWAFSWFGVSIEAWQGAILVFLVSSLFGGFASRASAAYSRRWNR